MQTQVEPWSGHAKEFRLYIEKSMLREMEYWFTTPVLHDLTREEVVLLVKLPLHFLAKSLGIHVSVHVEYIYDINYVVTYKRFVLEEGTTLLKEFTWNYPKEFNRWFEEKRVAWLKLLPMAKLLFEGRNTSE
jgi:hypothetical protein